MRTAVLALAVFASCGDPHAGDDHPSSADAPPSSGGDADTPDPTADAPPGSTIDLSRTALVIVVGDSIGAGYDASGRNGTGGQGYARQIVDNHPSHPDWANRSLRALRPDVQLRDLAESGATSADARARVQSALGSLPPEVDRDVLVLIHVGGNDFNDDIATMIDPNVAMQRAAELRANLADIIGRLRARYDHPADDHRARFLVDTIHDPTDGLGTIPPGFDDGFCATLASPILAPFREVALSNLALFNTEIAAEAAAQDAILVDVHAVFLGHGMNGGAARWLSDDCAHPTNEGHHQIRVAGWTALGGP